MDNIDFSKISFVLMDCDGVLTDGSLLYFPSGEVIKVFHAHDGYGVERGRQHGLKFAIITGKTAAVNKLRAQRLKIEELYEGSIDKVSAAEEIKAKYGLTDDNLCFIGDDAFDLPLLRKVAFSCAPPEAVEEVRNEVDYITKTRAGRGCVREVIDLILKKQNKI
ncbi:MAG TPA: HAD-IIIA family hydrolase [Gammaproteobacteria bacterium]|nr:HAD-IIIA family hydrolase [Gammaproteobacteria bacterium]